MKTGGDMKKITKVTLGVFLLSFLFSGVSFALSSDNTQGPEQGDGVNPIGGEIPFPFQAMNQKVELADGEKYTLIGRVVFELGEPYFNVDLELHPWLANQKRKDRPIYPLIASTVNWDSFEGQLVQIFVEAKGSVLLGLEKEHYEIFLKSIQEPVPYKKEEVSEGERMGGGR